MSFSLPSNGMGLTGTYLIMFCIKKESQSLSLFRQVIPPFWDAQGETKFHPHPIPQLKQTNFLKTSPQ
jgi:hypothetical protein